MIQKTHNVSTNKNKYKNKNKHNNTRKNVRKNVFIKSNYLNSRKNNRINMNNNNNNNTRKVTNTNNKERHKQRHIKNIPGIKYEPSKWNKDKMVKLSHNCYSYFLDLQSNRVRQDCVDKHNEYKIKRKQNKTKKKKYIPCGKPQPGAAAGLSPVKQGEYTCEMMDQRIRTDNPSIYKTNMKKGCNKDEYMGAMVLKPKDTYHFYRMNKNGEWSHKMGATKVTRLDADGKRIKDPRKSNRNFGSLKYKQFCHYYCIPYNRNKKRMALM
jgi:hypothetical protein